MHSFTASTSSASWVLLGTFDAVFDANEHWFSKSYLVQFSSSVLYRAWRDADRDPEVFLQLVREVKRISSESADGIDLTWGGPLGASTYELDEIACPQVTFLEQPSFQRVWKAPRRFPLTGKKAKQRANGSGGASCASCASCGSA